MCAFFTVFKIALFNWSFKYLYFTSYIFAIVHPVQTAPIITKMVCTNKTSLNKVLSFKAALDIASDDNW